MRKKYLIFTISLLVIIILSLGYVMLRNRNKVTFNALSAVPVDATFVFETNDISGFIRKLNRESKIWMELRELSSVKSVDQDMLFLDSLVQHVKLFREIIQKNSLFVSFHPTGKNKMGMIWYFNLPSKIHFRQIQELLRDMTSNRQLIEKEYNRTRILQLDFPAEKKKRILSVTVLDGIAMASTSTILLENAIRQIELPEGINDLYGFRKVAGTAGKNVDGNLYINFKTLPYLVSGFFDDSYRQEIEEFTPIGNWAELDVNIMENSILLNGFTYSTDSTNNYLNIFYNQSSPTLDAEEVLPANTIAYLVFGISDLNEFRSRYNNFLEKSGAINNRRSVLNDIRKELNTDIEEVFYSFIEDEMGIALTDIKNFTRAQNSLVFFKTKSKSQAEEMLSDLIRNYIQSNNRRLNEYMIRYEVDPETGFIIYRMPVHSLPGKIFGDLFGGAEYEYFTFIDRYLFFGNSIQALSRIIHNSVLHRTLQSDLSYREFSDNLSARSNFQIYISIPRLQTVLSSLITDQLNKNLTENSAAFQKIQSLALQFTANNSMVYNNLFINFQPLYKEEAITVWESMLDTSITMKPHFVLNHYTQDNEIFVQDNRNNIYLINSAGRILWKIPIHESVMGKVYQIDYYRNNKLQLLFNTQSQIHL
ncbi:MAG: DUF3352 domain-containing protein, partial [Bacteroidales bacterium]